MPKLKKTVKKLFPAWLPVALIKKIGMYQVRKNYKSRSAVIEKATENLFQQEP